MTGDLLVADFDTSTRTFLQKTLQEAGFATKAVASGNECLRLSFSDEKPSLILLGWQMPILTGIEILTLLKADERSNPIPVIMLGGGQESEDQALYSGAFTLLRKPIDIDTLLVDVRGALGVSV